MKSWKPGHAIATSLLGSAIVLGLTPPSLAQTKAAQMVDLAPNHWAYAAIQRLVEKYRVMGGFPDKTFRGQKPVSRYELAAALANIMDRLEVMGETGRVTNADLKTVQNLRTEFRPELEQRIVALEGQVKSLQGKIGSTDKVHGNIGITVLDDPQDRLRPYMATGFRVDFGSKLDGTLSYGASISGGRGANGSGNTPAITRDRNNDGTFSRGNPPGGAITLGANAGIKASLTDMASVIKVGHFAAGEFMNLGGFAAHWGDGIIGSGLAGAGGNPVRLGRDIGLGGKIQAGGLGAGLVVNSMYVAAGTNLDFGLGSLHLVGDVDHNSIGDLEIEGDPSYHLAGSLNLGNDKLGLSLRAGLNQKVPVAGAELVYNLGGVELSGAISYQTDGDGNTAEILPAFYVFVPNIGPTSWLFGLREPQTIQSRSGAGPGSLLGTKAGATVQVSVDNPLLPNLTMEANLQQDLLFGQTYDGWGYAISTSTGF